MEKTLLINLLISLGATFRGTSCCCVLCEDRKPSAWIYEKDGRWRYKCAKCGFCGDIKDIEKRKGITVKSVAPVTPRTTYKSLQEAVAVASKGRTPLAYKYTNPTGGNVELCVLRFDSPEGKTFSQISAVNGGYIIGGMTTNPIYNRTRVQSSNKVYVVEGEKCVHALTKVLPDGEAATTSPAGSNGANKADWSPVYGKEVYIIPDNDEAGNKYAHDVYNILKDKCAVKILDTSSFPPKGDMADVPVAERLDVLKLLLDSANSPDIQEYEDDLAKTFSGELANIPWPWPDVTKTTMSLRPGAITTLCGGAGEGKTYFVFQALVHWHSLNVKWALLELEEKKAYWISRALAQKCHDGNIANIEWRAANREAMQNYYRPNKEWVESFAKHIWCGTSARNTTEDVIKWTEERAKTGYRLIIIDPITGRSTDNTSKDDERLLNGIKQVAEKYHCSVVLITHPTGQGIKNKDGRIIPALESLAGGQAIKRFCAAVVWLQCIDTEEVNVYKSGYRLQETVNRIVHVFKARDANAGYMPKVGLMFENLQYIDKGVIVR